ncbi:MAG: phenylacetate--CoA ligase [Deltaproteobacteria bacterium]|nr:phenylacetate--CoA ligase [Deltaproteobacteria bacterium]
MYWNVEKETMDRPSLAKLQIELLRRTVERAARSPYYQKVFQKEGLSPASIRTLDDLRRFSFITKDTLREQYPYGFLATPKDEIVRLHSSSGTTGRPTVVFHTANDINEWTELLARCMYMVGVRKHDVFQNMMGYGLFTGGLGFHYGGERIGALVIPAGAGNTKRQIMLMTEFHTTVIHIIPSYALHFIKTLEEMKIDPKRDLHLRIAFLGAEPHSEATRKRIEEGLGINGYNSYGLSEMCGPGVAFECQEKQGMHVWEDGYILEVIDPKTREPVKDGDEGELVFTSLTREGMPLLRYCTRDVAVVYPEPCACGRTHRKISRIKGRTDDMMIVKGVNMYPIQIEKTLMAISGVGSNFQIILDTKEDNDHMIVKVEVLNDLFTGNLQQLNDLKKRITNELHTELLVTPEVELVEPNALPRSEGKAVRVIDKRDKWGD